MSIPEFKTADQVKSEAWEHQHDKVFNDLIRLSDYTLIHAKENTPEGYKKYKELCKESEDSGRGVK